MANVIEWAGFHINARMIAGANWSNIGRNSYEARIYIAGWPTPGYLSKDFQKQDDAIAAIAEVVRNMQSPDERMTPGELTLG
jgi:hypothetical protein